jgi:metal-sulfur cluster biosynthetic enzyme
MKDFYSIRPKIASAIRKVEDPELYVSVVDLGLLYNIRAQENMLVIEMTLTTMGCPLFETIEKDVKENIKKEFPDIPIKLKLVFDPPWSTEMVSPAAAAELGI